MFGLPMQLLGTWIAKNQDRLLAIVKPLRAVIIIAVGGAVSVGEYYLSHLMFEVTGSDFHISTVIVSFGLFMLALNFPRVKFHGPIHYVGEHLYMWVYLLHMFFGSLVSLIADIAGIGGTVYEYARPIIVLLLSCLGGMLINYLTGRLKNLRRPDRNPA